MREWRGGLIRKSDSFPAKHPSLHSPGRQLNVGLPHQTLFRRHNICYGEKDDKKATLVFISCLISSLLLTAPQLSWGQPGSQYPIADRVADKVIQKYQKSSCRQLQQESSNRLPLVRRSELRSELPTAEGTGVP
jgi:hypothetical protein